MSVAAHKSGSVRNRERLRAAVVWLDRAVANGRIPALLAAIVSGLLLGAFLFTDDYRVESVTVEGVEHGDVTQVAGVSGLLQRSVFDVDVEGTVARIADLSYVDSVTVDVSFPGRATISIVEREPLFVLKSDESPVLVSAAGEIIADGTDEHLPVLRVDEADTLPDSELTPAFVEAITAISAVYGPDVELLWSQEVGLAMELSRGRLVVFGRADEIESKLVVLGAIEDQLDATWTQLDLRVPTRPAYR